MAPGKSTLIKLLTGVYLPVRPEMFILGKAGRFALATPA